MNTDPTASAQRPDLSKIAAHPGTDLEVLRTLAFEYPHLRPTIALNPSTYPGLLDWLSEFKDQAVQDALKQRRESGPVYPQSSLQVGAATPVSTPGGQTQTGLSSEPKPKPNKLAIGVAIVLVLLAIPLVLIVGRLLFTTAEPDNVAASTPTQTMPETSTTPAQSSEPGATQSEVLYPAPAEAIEAARVGSPSGNILCELEANTVSCTILSTDQRMRGGACDDGSLTVTAADRTVGRNCSMKVTAEGGTTLDYGKFASVGDVACGSQENGMSCWNVKSGYSFAISRQGWTTGDEGFVPDTQYPWLQ